MLSPVIDVKSILQIISRILVLWPCHRIELRCPYVCGVRLPICFRCLGIIIGIPIGCILLIWLDVKSRWFGSVFFIPLIIDVTIQYDFNVESTNFRRSITGFCFGVGFSMYLIVWCRYNFI
jgi:uncharacterized membrane protein